MRLTISNYRNTDGYYAGGINEASGIHPVTDCTAKILITDKGGNLIPCNYQFWYHADDYGVGGGCYYVPTNEGPICPDHIEGVDMVYFLSKEDEETCLGYHIHNLMDRPPKGVQFIKYDGFEKVIESKYLHLFGYRIVEWKQTFFKHRFQLLKFKLPYYGEYESRIADAKLRASQHECNLARLEESISRLSLDDFLRSSDYELSSFEIMVVEHHEEKKISSGASLPSVDELLSLARKKLVRKAPRQTKFLVDLREEITEIPSTFFVEGKQRVICRCIALVPK